MNNQFKTSFLLVLSFVVIVLVSGCTDTQDTASATSEKTWHSVTTFTSSNQRITETFSISGDKWRFTWSCLKDNDQDGITIGIYREGYADYENLLFMQKCPETEETSYMYAGKGNFYFNVLIANLKNWTIVVEDYY